MATRPIIGNPSQIMVEQLAASGVKYVFYNSGSVRRVSSIRSFGIQI